MLTVNGATVLKVSRNRTAIANSIAQDVLPGTIQIVVTDSNANPVTNSVRFNLTNR